MAYQQTELEELWMRMQQFLVHGYLYYELAENIIEDYHYDMICKRLVELLNKYPEEAKQLPYYELTGDGGEGSGSAFYIKEYPPQIQTKALRMLWYHKQKIHPDFDENFADFVARLGRTLVGWEKIEGEWKYVGEEPTKKIPVPPKKKR